MQLKKISKLFLVGIFSICLPIAAHASKCVHPSVETIFNEAKLVFAARINSTEAKTKHIYQLKLTPLKIWKGEIEQSDFTYAMDQIEKAPFEKNRNYIFFLSQNNKREDGYRIWYCTPKEDIGYEDGYTISLLLDQLAGANIKLPNARTPQNTFVGQGFGITQEEIWDQIKRDDPWASKNAKPLFSN